MSYQITPIIKHLDQKYLAGHALEMSLLNNRTFELWRGFMPERTRITGSLPTELFSVKVYPEKAKLEDPNQLFQKWACVAVSDFENCPTGFQQLILENGLYAVFNYKGLSTDTRIFEYIFRDWFPDPGYVLAHRPHFEILGAKYRNNDPESEEEIWIPVSRKIQEMPLKK